MAYGDWRGRHTGRTGFSPAQRDGFYRHSVRMKGSTSRFFCIDHSYRIIARLPEEWEDDDADAADLLKYVYLILKSPVPFHKFSSGMQVSEVADSSRQPGCPKNRTAAATGSVPVLEELDGTVGRSTSERSTKSGDKGWRVE